MTPTIELPVSSNFRYLPYPEGRCIDNFLSHALHGYLIVFMLGMRVIGVLSYCFICCCTNHRGIAMKQVSPLLGGSRAVAVFAGIMIIAIANSANAQTGTTQSAAASATQSGGAGQGSPAPASSAVEQPKPGWNETGQDRRSWLSRIFGSSTPASNPTPASNASGKTDAAGWSSQGSENSGCYSSTGDEDFLCKLARLFWGPDTPRGPNQDMDSNITAGGAGG